MGIKDDYEFIKLLEVKYGQAATLREVRIAMKKEMAKLQQIGEDPCASCFREDPGCWGNPCGKKETWTKAKKLIENQNKTI